MTQGCTARREGFKHNFCPCGLGFCLGSDGKICYLNIRPLALVPSPTYHPDSCFKYNCPSGVTCLLRREGC